MTITKRDKKQVKRAYKVVGWFDRCMDDLCNDPMTHAMGAPIGDFASDWWARHVRQVRGMLKEPKLCSLAKVILENEISRIVDRGSP
jgi:hypothetical protein